MNRTHVDAIQYIRSTYKNTVHTHACIVVHAQCTLASPLQESFNAFADCVLPWFLEIQNFDVCTWMFYANSFWPFTICRWTLGRHTIRCRSIQPDLRPHSSSNRATTLTSSNEYRVDKGLFAFWRNSSYKHHVHKCVSRLQVSKWVWVLASLCKRCSSTCRALLPAKWSNEFERNEMQWNWFIEPWKQT